MSPEVRRRLSQLAETLARLAAESAHDAKASADGEKTIARLAEGAAYIIASRAVRAARDQLIGLDELGAELAYREGDAAAGAVGDGRRAAYAVARKALADIGLRAR